MAVIPVRTLTLTRGQRVTELAGVGSESGE